MSELIDGGDVKLNWRTTGVKASATVKKGDVISVRGKGRVTVGEISMTKKERFSVELHRLV
jgi:RNA-binding protein YlmH